MRTFKFALAVLATMFLIHWSVALSFAGGYGSQVTSANVILNDLGAAGYCQTYQAAGQLNVVARQVAPVTFNLVPYQPQVAQQVIQPQVVQPQYQAPATVQLQVTQPAYSYSAAVVQPQTFSYSHSFRQDLNAGGYGGFGRNVRFNGHHGSNQAVRFNQVGHGFNQAVRFNQRLDVRGAGNQRIVNKTVTKSGALGLRNRQVTKAVQKVRSR